ncbi:hypothetical protein [Acetanaerobacterium elongatum]|uniref:HEAT repeat domain-containing protein n=1 Tax=Acetanaerobacterium elongatum TaxID=258515 RepID=A0A1G9WG41_9FIRM|nr:hypothetical protein [Acetanaerobacterium elongatum]SDM83542.1 hypothetical protein SAMN05192585_1069 [Acetanaerobacterium elongatum]
MLSYEQILQNGRTPSELAQQLTAEDIAQLFGLLREKDNELRYSAFLLLQERSKAHADVYPYWDGLCEKLDDENSYQRSLGVMLLAENVRWDAANRFDKIAESYLARTSDEKFITSRQTIQSIAVWVELKPNLHPLIVDTLTHIDIASLKDTQQKLILLDILGILVRIQKQTANEAAADYIARALTGGVLDKKSVKIIKDMLG